jgi:uncharacterized protein (TIGR00369 family)
MRYQVKARQENASMCFVCGLENKCGLCAAFFELENGELLGVFKPGPQHQGYPGRLHGGIAATMLDEVMGRAINAGGRGTWGVTVDLNIRYRQPVPLGQEIRALGRVVREGGRSYEAEGRILLPDGSTAVEGHGRYMILPIEKIADVDEDALNWRVVPGGDDPREVEIDG